MSEEELTREIEDKLSKNSLEIAADDLREK